MHSSPAMRGGRMPPYMRNPIGQKLVVNHATFDPVQVCSTELSDTI